MALSTQPVSGSQGIENEFTAARRRFAGRRCGGMSEVVSDAVSCVMGPVRKKNSQGGLYFTIMREPPVRGKRHAYLSAAPGG
jgi:hypothetical protein